MEVRRESTVGSEYVIRGVDDEMEDIDEDDGREGLKYAEDIGISIGRDGTGFCREGWYKGGSSRSSGRRL